MSDYDEYEMEPSNNSGNKMKKFAHTMSDWLMLGTAIFIVLYLILYAFYEIALGMAHIRWVYNVFLLMCLIDIVAYFLTRFAVLGEVNRCLVYLSTIIFFGTTLANLIIPACVLVSYELTLEHPSGYYPPVEGIENISSEEGEEVEEYFPQDCAEEASGVST